ncbi:PD-(D/E)XK nuclease-like domain-containing protein [Salmonella enterica]|uniref:DNA breaking-rejoining protein n=1 Tax=Salmonella enterica subsp. enterica serovar Panama TaxID=29472 RepID=A0A5U8J4L5_SALET|nr:RecE family exodeoxyribonuclease [Salmonella enterica]EBR7994975.1 DNA breaking-rejoining protein [Salmonella enterica subsp. enterica serovar Panama]ASD90122.1 DNA breaking-rejoining protein [Salmonella enterica subsp. enterica serovar India str. SA20085604]EBR8432937.1 DNA breaking-rejoining protein [Salmonella enterica subsp. enterica serovar Panama]EBW9459965.1 DNA breaking-rejoining protein [Salmonella enterica subsp. enterica serovar Panama]EJC4644790.1 PD-(D/E)XK nuclease-like domain
MSDNKEDFALHCPVKNEEARKRLGIKAGFFWTTAKKLSVAVSRCIAAMDDKGYDEDDFKKPVRVNLPAIGDLPPEGVFDTEFCNRYEKGGEDGKTMMLIPGAAPADQFHGEAVENTTVINDTPVTDTESDSDDSAGAPLPAYAYNVNGELMSDVEKDMTQSVSGKSFAVRFRANWKQPQCVTDVATWQLQEINAELMDPTGYMADIELALSDKEIASRLDKLEMRDVHCYTRDIEKVFPENKRPGIQHVREFTKAWLDTDYIDRGLLVKEWQKGNRVSCINRTPSGANAGGGIQSDRKMPQTILGLEFEIALGLLARKYEFDIYSLPLEIELKANTIMNAVDDPEWLATRELFVSIPGGLDYSRACVIATVKTTPENLYESPFRHREHLNKVLTETDHATPDPLVVNIACGRSSLPMPMKGSTNDDEEKPQSAGAMADEPAASEAVEQDTTEHHPDPQPLENEPPVSQTEAGYKKIRAELHEARKNIPPKNPVDVGKQLAAARGEYVEGISDPDDPKWVHNDYSASNEGEKTEVATDNATDPADFVDHSEAFTNQPETVTDQNEPETEPEHTWPEYFEPGRYEGVPNDIYHAANGISSTMVKDARVSLMYYEGRHVSKTIKKERSKVLDMGNLVHVLALQPEILDEEFSIEPEIPEGALTTTATIRAVIDDYNNSLPVILSTDDIKRYLDEYNATLPQPVPLGDDVAQTGESYMSLPPEFQRVEEGQKVTAAKMKACIKEYNATLPTQMKTSGSRDTLLEQLAVINPDLVAQEAQKPQPLKVSGAKADLIQAVKSVSPETVFADELLEAWRENPGDKILVTRQQYATALAIQSALYAHPEAGKLLQNPTRAVEVSYFGIDDDTGLEIRVRPDVELEYEGLRIGFDLKTISMWDVKEDALKSRLHREITMRDYHLSAGMYCNVADLDKFAWIFVNKDEGYHWVAVVWASESLLELGKLEYHRTIRAIANAMDTDEWPAPVTADYTDELNDYDLRRLDALREIA